MSNVLPYGNSTYCEEQNSRFPSRYSKFVMSLNGIVITVEHDESV